MQKAVLIPDSFKGSMSSREICDIMGERLRAHYPGAQIVSIPVADGGEGTVDAFLGCMEGELRRICVKGPFFEPVDSFYGIMGGGTAVIEMAACAGLPLAAGRLDPGAATTYGVGELILDAVSSGCKNIILGLGGSCTNDGGAGMAAALGVRFFGENGESFIPTGGTLSKIRRIDIGKAGERLAGVNLTAMCDIDNPLCGPAGAAHVFGPQKGADEAMARFLDEGLRNMALRMKEDLGADIAEMPGAGAAGGLGAGAAAFLGAKLCPGIDAVLDAVRFPELIRDADIVFTGEGRLDSQSLRGKVVAGVARRAKEAGVPVIAVVGGIADDIGPVYDMGVSAVFSINRTALPLSEALPRSKTSLALTMDDIIRLLKTAGF